MAADLLRRANAVRHQTRKSATATAVYRRSCNLFQGRQERTLRMLTIFFRPEVIFVTLCDLWD
jgi:hypothetical protein